MSLLFWAILGIVLFAALVISSQLEFLIPAIAAFLVLFLSFIPGIHDNFIIQAGLWLAFSVFGLISFRKKIQELKLKTVERLNSDFLGKKALVTEPIKEEMPGRVKFQGTTWIAKSHENLNPGDEVEILGRDGIVLQVERTTQERIESEFLSLEKKSKEKE